MKLIVGPAEGPIDGDMHGPLDVGGSVRGPDTYCVLTIDAIGAPVGGPAQ